MKLVSWNVNGIRAAEKKGLVEYILSSGSDIVCLQEIKANEDQISLTVRFIPGFHSWFCPASRPGYSGTAVFSRIAPRQVKFGFGIPEFDLEGRVILLDFEGFRLYNIYFPNGGSGPERLAFKLRFYDAFLARVTEDAGFGNPLVICGDVNTAHKAIDLARPKENQAVSGFLPEERAFLDRFTASGFVDTFRMFNHEGGHYTWWDMKTRARDRNIGWRLDYFYVSENLAPAVRSAFIQPDIQGSDHCPVGLEIGL